MRIGRVRGIEFSINNWFLALLGVYFAAGVLDKGLTAFAAVLLHEAAHTVVARRLNFAVDRVELLPFGGVARMSNRLVLEPAKEIKVAAAGPLTNLVLIVTALGLQRCGIWHETLGPFFVQCNLILFLFNLLPGLPLDGGRVFRALLARRMNLPAATHRMAVMGQFWGLSVMVLGSVGAWYRYNGLDLVAIGCFLFFMARREKREAPYLYAQHLASKQRELARRGYLPGETVVVLDSVPAWKVTRTFRPERYHIIYVVDEEGSYRGKLDETAVVRAVMNRGTGVLLGQLKKDFLG